MGTFQDAPLFTPTAEEFKNFAKYVESIEDLVVDYGICRIRPPTGWKARKSSYDKAEFKVPFRAEALLAFPST